MQIYGENYIILVSFVLMYHNDCIKWVPPIESPVEKRRDRPLVPVADIILTLVVSLS